MFSIRAKTTIAAKIIRLINSVNTIRSNSFFILVKFYDCVKPECHHPVDLLELFCGGDTLHCVVLDIPLFVVMP